MAAIAIAIATGAGSTKSSASDAQAYVQAVSNDAHQLQNELAQIGQDILTNDATSLAKDVQTMHDAMDGISFDISAASTNVSDNSTLGHAENQVMTAMDEFKSGTSALVAYLSNPNSGALGVTQAKSLDQASNDWNQGVQVISSLAGHSADNPTIGGQSGTSQTASATTSTQAGWRTQCLA